MAANKPFTSFYDSIGFAPTRQTPSLAASHNERRSILYRSLGIPSIAIQGSRVLEFGPGSGENCESVLSHRPSSYRLVDGSKAVLSSLREKLSDVGDVSLTYVLSDIEQYSDEDLYDLVICEGVLPLQENPKYMANHIMRFARPGGVVVMTCFDSCSGFSEWCRRFVAQQLFGDLTYSPGLVKELTKFFEPDLKFLPGMSRQPEDWVVDTLINPWIGDFFSLRDALQVARGQAAFLGSSPRFLQDWRWYKDPSNFDNNLGLELIDSWLSTYLYMFLDTRIHHLKEVTEVHNADLAQLTTKVAERTKLHMGGGDRYAIDEFGEDVAVIADQVRYMSKDTFTSLRGLADWADSGRLEDLSPFRAMWGRAQQFISLVKIASDTGC